MAKKIKVPNEAEFQTVCKLIDANISQNETRYTYSDNSIYVDDFEFTKSKEFVEEQTADNGYVETEHGITKKFMRFDNFNANTRTDANAMTWENVVNDNIDTFYKLNSFLKYAPYDDNDCEGEKEIIETKLKRALPYVADRMIFARNDDIGKETIYEVAVKFRFVFRGEPKYVINKFYFDGNFALCSSSQSRLLYAQVDALVKEATANEENNEEVLIESDQVTKITNNILAVMQNQSGFQDYLIGEAKTVFDNYVKDTKNNGVFNVEVSCDRVKLRYIAHLRMRMKEYLVIDALSGQKIFDVRLGVKGELNVYCSKCGNEIISQDIIPFARIDINGKQTVAFGDINEMSESDLANSTITKHCQLPPVTCKSCTKLLCLTQLEKCSECGKTLCIDCSSNNIVSQYNDGKTISYYHTSCAVYCEDTFETLPKAYTKRCTVCGKIYSTKYFRDKVNMCKLCEPIYTDEVIDDELYRKIYNTHKNMLPLHLRNKKNICNENFDSILFKVVIGNNDHVYYFDKSQLLEDKPFKIKKLL